MPENSILSPVSLTSYFDNATGEARQANLFFYKAGTLDPIVAYTDATLHIPYPQPVATTGWGRVPPVYIGEIPAPGYRVRTFDQFQTLIEDLDGLPGAAPDPAEVAPPTPVAPEELFRTGDIKLSWQNHQTLPGWVEITLGGTIGNVGSNASLMQSADCHDLFIHLWQQDAVANANVVLKVIPSKGASAQGDWDDGRQIEVPDVRGRFLAGLDSQQIPATTPPSSTTGRLDKGVFSDLPNTSGTKMVPWTLGAFGGESVHKLTKTELAVHFHDWIDLAGHTHAILEPNSGQGHKHGLVDPKHDHGTIISTGSTNAVLGRTTSSPDYLWEPTTGTKLWSQVTLSTQSVGTGMTMSFGITGIELRHANYTAAAGTAGSGLTNMFIGAFSKVPDPVEPPVKPPYGTGDDKWHNKTENYPIVNDGSDGTDMGDRPHNTLPPFILFAIYMKL